jgi:hypothetical protein
VLEQGIPALRRVPNTEVLGGGAVKTSQLQEPAAFGCA